MNKCFVMGVLVLAMCGHVSAEEKTPPATTRAADATRYAEIEIGIDSTTPVKLKQEAVFGMLRQRAAELAPQILGLPGVNTQDWLGIEGTWGQNSALNTLRIRVSVDAKARPAALAFADALVDAVREYAKTEIDRQRATYLGPVEEQTRRAEKTVQEARDRARSLREQIRELSGRSDASGKTISEIVAKLEEEKQKLELDVMGKDARREALENQIAEQSARIEKKSQDDPIVTELSKVVDARQAQLNKLKEMTNAGTATPTELDAAIANAAEARARLLERKHAAAMEAGGDALAALNRELLSLSVDLREFKARLSYIDARLPKLRQAVDLGDALSDAQSETSLAESKARGGQKRIDELRTVLAETPTITLISREGRETRDLGSNVVRENRGVQFEDGSTR